MTSRPKGAPPPDFAAAVATAPENTPLDPVAASTTVSPAGSVAERTCTALTDSHPVLDADGLLYGCLMFAPSGLDLTDPRLRESAEDLAWGRLDDPGFEKRRGTFAAEIRNRAIFTSAPDLKSRYGECRDCPAGRHARSVARTVDRAARHGPPPDRPPR